MGVLRHKSGKYGNLLKVELVGDSINRDGTKSRVSQDYLVRALRSRVAVKSRQNIRLKILSDGWNLGEERLADSIALFLLLSIRKACSLATEIKGQLNLLVQVIESILDINGEAVVGVVDLIRPVPEVARVDNLEQVINQFLNLSLVGPIVNVNSINISLAFVIGEYVLNDSLYLFFFNNIRHGISPSFDGLPSIE